MIRIFAFLHEKALQRSTLCRASYKQVTGLARTLVSVRLR